MKRILCLAFILISSISIFAQEKIIEKSDSGKTFNGPILKAEGKLTPTSVINENKDQITEVSLERKGCNGFCPIDKVTFRLNGPHSYKGMMYVNRIGDFQADLKEYKLGVLVKVLERVNYADLKDEYMRVIDSQVVILSVTRGGKTKTIKSDSSETTPIEFVIIQAFIVHVTSMIDWKKVG